MSLIDVIGSTDVCSITQYNVILRQPLMFLTIRLGLPHGQRAIAEYRRFTRCAG
jgi:hypothetical protein